MPPTVGNGPTRTALHALGDEEIVPAGEGQPSTVMSPCMPAS